MEIGSGIALAGVSASIGAVLITAIRSYAPPGVEKKCDGDVCQQHSGIIIGIEGIRKSLDRQEKSISEINHDVKMMMRKETKNG